jgi:peptidyl-prolyl cis-trans isomerase C
MTSIPRRLIIAIAAGGCLALSSCTRQPEQTQEVARVDDQSLTSEMIRQHLDTAGGISEMQVRMFARQWVNSELLYQEAKRQGLDRSDAVLRNLESAKRELAINALLEKDVFNDTPQSISKDEIAVYFKSHAEEFALRDDIVEISLAVFSEREPAAAFREEALQGAGWEAALADSQNAKNGQSPLITKTDSAFYTQSTLFPPKLWKVSSALGAGEVSFPVKTSAGYFVILLIGSYQRGSTPPVEYVADAIRGRLVMQRRQEHFGEYLETMRKKHTVQINLPGVPAEHDSLRQPGE